MLCGCCLFAGGGDRSSSDVFVTIEDVVFATGYVAELVGVDVLGCTGPQPICK